MELGVIVLSGLQLGGAVVAEAVAVVPAGTVVVVVVQKGKKMQLRLTFY